MKNLIAILLVLLTSNVFAQSNVVSNTSVIPTAVTDAFVKKFPTATDVQWDTKTTKTSADIAVYHVTFNATMKEKTNEAWIDKDGKLLKHKKQVPAASLPEPVHQSVRNNFPGFTAGDADRLEENGVVSYIFEVKSGNRARRVAMDAEGKMQTNVHD